MLEYFLEFHWWYILIGLVILFIFFGESKGGFVSHSYKANLEIIDEDFSECTGYSSRVFFSNEKDEKFEIDIDGIPLAKGQKLDVSINDKYFKTLNVKRNRELEYVMWKNENSDFLEIEPNDKITVFYKKNPILEGSYVEC